MPRTDRIPSPGTLEQAAIQARSAHTVSDLPFPLYVALHQQMAQEQAELQDQTATTGAPGATPPAVLLQRMEAHMNRCFELDLWQQSHAVPAPAPDPASAALLAPKLPQQIPELIASLPDGGVVIAAARLSPGGPEALDRGMALAGTTPIGAPLRAALEHARAMWHAQRVAGIPSAHLG